MEKIDELLGITEKAVTVVNPAPMVPRVQTEDEDNDDFKDPTCKFASWKLTPEEAGIIMDVVDEDLKEKEDKTNYDLPLAVQ